MSNSKTVWHAVVATDLKGAIGKNNTLPWHISSELKNFKSITMGHTLLWGHKTFASLPGVLKGRKHLVLSRQPRKSTQEDVYYFTSMGDLFLYIEKQKEENIFVCGGAEIFKLFMPYVQFLHLTVVQTAVENADTFFPEYHLKEWEVISHRFHQHAGELSWDYQLLKKK